MVLPHCLGYGAAYNDRYVGREGYDDPLRRGDPFYERQPPVIKPTVFEYGHETKLGLYDVDLSVLKDLDSITDQPGTTALPTQLDRDAPVSPRLDHRDRPPRPSSPSRRSRSPRRGSSPRRKSFSPRRSASGSRRSRSPSRRSRRSTSRQSPPRGSRRDDRSRDINDRSRDRDDRRRSRTDAAPYSDSDRAYGNVARDGITDLYTRGYESVKSVEPVVEEPGPEVVPIKDIMDKPSRDTRPKHVSMFEMYRVVSLLKLWLYSMCLLSYAILCYPILSYPMLS